MLSRDEGIDDPVETGSKRVECVLGLWDKVSGFGASQLKFPLEVGRGHFEVTQGHSRVGMAEQFHEGRKAHTSPKHHRGVGMPELMRDDSGGEPEGMTDLVQVIAKLMKDCFLAVPAGEQSPVGGQRIEGTKESQAIEEITDKRIDGNHAFRL